MTRSMRLVTWAALLAGCPTKDPTPTDTTDTVTTDTTDTVTTDTVTTDTVTTDTQTGGGTAERGQYLVDHLLACGDCHTPRGVDGAPDPSQYLAGVECFIDINGGGTDNGGCLHTANLTDDPTGLQEDDDAALAALLTTGQHGDEVLFPVMPYWIYANLTPEDVDSIVKYLRTVPGISRALPERDPLFDRDTPAAPFDLANLPVGTATAELDQPSIDSGRYLASVACVDCHTALLNPLDPRSIDESRVLAGGRDFDRDLIGLPPSLPAHVYSTNLTPDATGLADYSQLEIFLVLQQGVDPTGAGVCPPMPSTGGKEAPFRGLTPGDANDLAVYLKSIPPVENAVAGECALPQ